MALLGVEPVKLVGILNITPDSFSDGGLFVDPAKALTHAQKLFNDGASLIDVGAESTRPRATPLTSDEEWQRLAPVLPELIRLYPGKISLDTYHPETAERALQHGQVIINDVTGMSNPEMVEIVARHKASCIVSYLPGSDLQLVRRQEPVSDIKEVVAGLRDKLALLVKKGISADKIIADPGIGFGKTPELNRQLLTFAKYMPGQPVMIGYSRKRFLGERHMELAPNLEAAKVAIAAGAAYLRVHDVAGHRALLDPAA